MGYIPEKKEQFDLLLETANEFADQITAEMGDEGFVYISSEEGTDEEPAGLVFIDVPSFSTFSMNGKLLLENIIHIADAVNLFVTDDGWVRITLAIDNVWEREAEAYSTDIINIFTS